MKSTIKQLLKFTAYTTVVALFFSCTPTTGGSITGLGTDTGTGTTTTATTGGSTTGSGTDTGTGTTTSPTGGSSTGSGTGTGTGTTTGTSGVSFSTTYNDPALPENIGTDPFKGHTYGDTYPDGSTVSYTFGNNGELTNTFTATDGTTTSKFGKKYSYSYDATTKELSLKCTHILQKVPGPTEYRWYTYAELINFILNITRSQLAEMGDPTTYTDEQLKELIQNNCIHIKNEFETTKIWKAELDTSNNLELRTDYYKTAPSSLPNNSPHFVFYTLRQGPFASFFYLSIGPTTTDTSNSSSNESGSFLYSKGSINTFSNSAGTSTSKIFSITNITSNTISAVETTSSSAGHTIVSGGITLQLSYTYALGNDNNLLVTVTGSDDTTKDFLRTLLGDNTLTNPSITASSSTEPTTYTFVE